MTKTGTASAMVMVGVISLVIIIGLLQIMKTRVGLKLEEYKKEENSIKLPEEIQKLVDQRNEARTNKNWNESDRIRDILIDKGYIIKDSKDGTIVQKQ